jgi:hypothetical protein
LSWMVKSHGVRREESVPMRDVKRSSRRAATYLRPPDRVD